MAFIFQKVGRDRAEIFKVLKNGSTSAIGPGNAVCYDYTTKADGLAVILPTTAMLPMFAGVVASGKTLAASGEDGQYNKVQVYGHHPAVYVAGSSLVPGHPLVPVGATGYMTLGVTNVATADVQIQFAVAGTTGCAKASSTFGNSMIAFIRAM